MFVAPSTYLRRKLSALSSLWYFVNMSTYALLNSLMALFLVSVLSSAKCGSCFLALAVRKAASRVCWIALMMLECQILSRCMPGSVFARSSSSWNPKSSVVELRVSRKLSVCTAAVSSVSFTLSIAPRSSGTSDIHSLLACLQSKYPCSSWSVASPHWHGAVLYGSSASRTRRSFWLR